MGKTGAKFREAYKKKRRLDNKWLKETPNMDELFYMNQKDNRKSFKDFSVKVYYSSKGLNGVIDSTLANYGLEIDDLLENDNKADIEVHFEESNRFMRVKLNAKGIKYTEWIKNITIRVD